MILKQHIYISGRTIEKSRNSRTPKSKDQNQQSKMRFLRIIQIATRNPYQKPIIFY